MRAPVKRQMTIAEAVPSTAEDAAQVSTLIEFASIPARTPSAPSSVIQNRLAHASSLAWRAARSHGADRSAAEGAVAIESCAGAVSGLMSRTFAGVY